MQIKQLSTSPQVLHGLSGCCVAVFTIGSRYFPSRSIQIDVTQFFLIANQFAVCSTLIAGASWFLVPILSKALIYMLMQLLKLTTTIILVQWVRSIASQFLAIGPSNPKVKMVSFWGITVYRESEICVFALGVSCLQHCIQYFRSTRGPGERRSSTSRYPRVKLRRHGTCKFCVFFPMGPMSPWLYVLSGQIFTIQPDNSWLWKMFLVSDSEFIEFTCSPPCR